ncbi:MAG: alpha/beta hydrolase [Clostridia bacterium]|nr:alpha/beta hydrolase [Clostridia bacterium]
MKKLICLCLLLVLALSGCGKTPVPSQTAEPAMTSQPPGVTPEPGVSPRPVRTEEPDATEVVINPGEWELPGTLRMPQGDGPFPCVVFVPTSDRDETTGNQTLYRDLADDLAGLGIASIRYDNRTKIYSDKMDGDVNITVAEETVDDAVHAAKLAASTENIDSAKVFVAAHGLGGYLIPRIAAADAEDIIAGYIGLAAHARPIMTVYLAELDYSLSLGDGMTEEQKASVRASFAEMAKAVSDLTEADRGSDKLVSGYFPTFWLDLAGYDPLAEAKKIDKPLFFLQGEHDYKVTMADFDMWKAAVPEAAFLPYPGLTHMFTKTEAMGSPADYENDVRVDKAVAASIAEFAKK